MTISSDICISTVVPYGLSAVSMLYFRKGATAKYFIHWPLLALGATITRLIRVLSLKGFVLDF
jgi:hypothetical protein